MFDHLACKYVIPESDGCVRSKHEEHISEDTNPVPEDYFGEFSCDDDDDEFSIQLPYYPGGKPMGVLADFLIFLLFLK